MKGRQNFTLAGTEIAAVPFHDHGQGNLHIDRRRDRETDTRGETDQAGEREEERRRERQARTKE